MKTMHFVNSRWLVGALITVASMSAVVAGEPKTRSAGKQDAGSPFREATPPGKWLVGLNVGIFTDQSQHKEGTVHFLQPIWEGKEERETGPAFGHEATQAIRVEAAPGYVVAGAVVRADDRVRGLRLIFFRREGEKLNPQDRYESRWIGGRSGEEATLVADAGEFVIGIEGRLDQSLRSLGLRFDSQPIRAPAEMPEAAPPPFQSTPDYEQALAEVKKWGVPLVFDESAPGQPLQEINLSGRTLSAERLQILGRLKSLQSLSLAPSYGNLPPEALQPLAQLPALRDLDLSGTFWIRDPHLLLLREIPRLERINLSNTGITAAGLSQLVGMTRMKELVLTSAKIDDTAVETLRKFPRLEALALKGTAVSDAGLLRLAPLKTLTELQVYSGVLGDDAYQVLEQLPQLKSLAASGEITGAALRPLEKMRLKSLVIGAQTSEEDFAVLRSQRELVDLQLINVPISDDGLAPLAEAKQLQTIYIQRAAIGGAGLRSLSAETLKSLTLFHCPVNDDGLASLRQFAQLKQLKIVRGEISNAALAHLAALEQLEELTVHQCAIDDDGLAHLAKLPKLKRLDLTGCRVAGPGMAALAESKTLETVVVQANPFTDDGMEHLGRIAGLKELNIDNTRVSNAGVARIAGLERLTLLTAAYTAANDGAFDDLAKLTSLEQLNLAGWSLDDKNLAKLKPLTKLKMLGLTSTGVTNAGLEHLDAQTELQFLYAGQTRLAREGLVRLRKTHPYIEIWTRSQIPEPW